MTMKRQGAPAVAKRGWHASKKPRSDDGRRVRSSSLSENSSEESSLDCTSRHDSVGAVGQASSLYDKLLSTLESGSVDIPKESRRHERKEEDDDKTISISMSDEGGSGSESDVDHEYEGSDDELQNQNQNGLNGRCLDDLVEHTNDDEGDESEAFDEDYVTGLGSNGQVAVHESTSCFRAHLEHALTQTEVSELINKKWKYKWEAPAIDTPKSKWVGTGETALKEVQSTGCHSLLQSLYNHWLRKCDGNSDFNSSRLGRFFSLCSSYHDLMHCNKKPFYARGQEEDSSIMDAYIMHSLNHVFRTRNLVTKNDAKLAKHKNNGNEEIIYGDAFRDQGYTRPKVLILLPFKSIALRFVKRLIEISPLENVRQNDWFFREYGIEEVEEDVKKTSTKPKDHQVLFGGNHDDDFMFGIKITKKCIKISSKDFDTSDLIVASPLCLSFKINEAKDDKTKDVDCLSSIEVLVIDHADIMAMQNWSYVSSVVEKLNQKPVKKCADIMRIRQWYLDGYARFYRQTILLGYFPNSEMNFLFHSLCLNYEGKVKLASEYKGILSKVLLQVRQVYERFPASSVLEADDSRFTYFTTKIYPKIKDSVEGGIMLFTSSYLDFVRIRNFLHSEHASFCFVSGYTEKRDIPRARLWFYEGKKRILVCDERFHFLNRYKIRGVKNIIIYSLPERKEFYPELLNMLDETTNLTCTVLFSQFDNIQLERIVGTPYAKRMLSSNKDMLVFA